MPVSPLTIGISYTSYLLWLAVCAEGLTTLTPRILLGTGLQFKDPPNTEQAVEDGGGKGAQGHVTGKR